MNDIGNGVARLGNGVGGLAGGGRLALLGLLVLGPLPAWAAFEEAGAGGRAPGMANAFAAVADDVYAIHYNPAGLALLSRPEVGASYGRHLLGLTDGSDLGASFLGYAHPLKAGRWGAAGAAIEHFSLDSSLYQEQAFILSHGRRLASGPRGGSLLGGANVKYLRRSFGTLPEAGNAMRGIAATGKADPVLSGASSAGAVDLDLGLLYRLKRSYSFGLAVLHMNEPDVAFNKGRPDAVPREFRAAGAYQSLLSNLVVQYESRAGAARDRYNAVVLALERWFPRLLHGDFGARGALGFGGRDYKEITCGLSYRTGRMGLDYAFSIPINTVASTAGSHRVGLSFRFGKAGDPDESVLLILDAMRQLRTGKVPEFRAAGLGLTPVQRAAFADYMAQANAFQSDARYQDALERLGQAVALAPADTELLKSFGKLNFVAQHVRELPLHRTDPVQSALHEGALAYLGGDDRRAVEKLSAALMLGPESKGVDGFLSQVELATGLKRPQVPAASPERVHREQKLAQARAALQEGRYEDAQRFALSVAQDDPSDLGAWEILGTARFAAGDFAGSFEAWQKAYALEKDPVRKPVLGGYLQSLRRLLEKPAPPPQPAPQPAPPPAAKRPETRAEPQRPAIPPQELQRLHQRGVAFYTAGELERAKEMFELVLEHDPAYAPAAKALRRINEELSQR